MFRKVKILTSTFRLCSCIPSPFGLVPFTNLPPDSERKRKIILLTYVRLLKYKIKARLAAYKPSL